MKNLVLSFIKIFALYFVVAAAVTYLYNLLVHSTGIVDWGNGCPPRNHF